MRLPTILLAALTLSVPLPAAADESYDLELGVKWAAGFGAALEEIRPVFFGSFGMDVAVPVGGNHSVGAAMDLTWRERPGDRSGIRKIDTDTLALYRWTRPRRRKGRFQPWMDVGIGYRQLSYDEADTMLGKVRLHGASIRLGGGGKKRLGKDGELGAFFHWTVGCYMKSTRSGADGYVEMHDEPAPAPRNPGCVDTLTSMYAWGVRWSLRFH